MNGQFTPDAALVPLMTPELRSAFSAHSPEVEQEPVVMMGGYHGDGADVSLPSPRWDPRYRRLEAGETILATDEVQNDDGTWRAAVAVGSEAPDPSYTSHRIYRRLLALSPTAIERRLEYVRNLLGTTELQRRLVDRDGAWTVGALLASLKGGVELEWFGAQRNLELFFHTPVYADDDDDAQEWRVSKVSGPINDREWETVGRGATPIEAIKSAYAALSTPQSDKTA